MEAAKIPFYLWASNEPHDLHDGRLGWWHFHRITYEKNGESRFEAHVARSRQAHSTLWPAILKDMCRWIRGTIVSYNDDREIVDAYQGGEQIYPPAKPSTEGTLNE